MTCPFLKEAQVKSCQMAGVRKLIPMSGSSPAGPQAPERCSSPAYAECPVFLRQPAEAAAECRCPWLQEALMQFCGAAPVPRYIPYSESVLSRCGNGCFRYCEAYLGMAHPDPDAGEVNGVPMPGWLRYTANHLWLDVAEDGTCHAGIDGFLARALGPLERIGFVWQKGYHRPAAVLTAGGLDVQVIFPNPMLLTGCNLYLRADPSRCTHDPYRGGWLFEGKLVPETTEGLMDGEAARAWMLGEHGRMNEFIHEHLLPEEAGAVAADGGVFVPGLVCAIERDEALRVWHEFFSPLASDPRR